MGARLHKKDEDDGTIPMRELLEGQVGVVTASEGDEFNGQIVQKRTGCEGYMKIGDERYWGESYSQASLCVRVRVLQPGELIEIT